ncbi:uncharacterized protein LOC110866838 [Helianthus annuus]|nr:uncharacterized protein LOC110866838 [Helianthus annuus]
MRFPALYALAKEKRITVKNCVKQAGDGEKWDWEWRRNTKSLQEAQQFEELKKILEIHELVAKEDVWRWKTQQGELLSVALIRDEIAKKTLEPTDVPWKYWNKWVPPKVNLFTWRAFKRRIATKVELAKRGIHMDDRLCSRCNKEDESVNHLLISCLKSRAIWWNIMVWLKLPIQENSESCEDVFEKIEGYNGSKEWKNVIKAIVMTTLWQIWKARNDVEFNEKERSVANIIDGIKELSFLWIKERAKMKNLVWERWKEFNIRDIIK